jgi:hypothetical protein
VWQLTRQILESYYCSTSEGFVFIPQFLSETLMMFRGILVGKHWSRPGLISLALGTRHSLLSQFLYFICPTSVSVFWSVCLYIHIYDSVVIVYELPLLPNSTAPIGSGAKWWLDIYHWDSGLVETGRICDTGQNDLQFSLQTGISSNPSYYQRFFLIVFLEEAFVRNTE